MLSANLDRDTVLVSGEYLDIESAVQRRRGESYLPQPWAACLPLCLPRCISILSTQANRQNHYALDMSPSDLSLAGSA